MIPKDDLEQLREELTLLDNTAKNVNGYIEQLRNKDSEFQDPIYSSLYGVLFSVRNSIQIIKKTNKNIDWELKDEDNN